MPVRLLAFVLLCSALFAPRLAAFSLTGTRWTGASATLHLQLGANATPLADGSASWGASAEDALSLWNVQLANFRFNVVRDSTAAKAQGNRVNNVHFANTIYGEAWGGSVLAVTLTYAIGSSNTETDVVFNNQLAWDSYRGPQRRNTAGQSVYDFHRVALHEFGHALGLDHPDENGQTVSALMNSRISSLDSLTSDDIAGGQSLYGATTTPTTPSVSAPVITSHPTSRTIAAGQSTTFAVIATSSVTPGYQWFKNSAAIAGATASSYTIGAATSSDAGTYTVTVSNSAGAVTSSPATLTVTVPTTPTTPTTPPPPTPTAPSVSAPQILASPSSQSITQGQSATFTVTAGGTAPLAYQWRKDNTAISGATSATYTIAIAQPGDAGAYSAIVSNSAGSAVSAAATLTINIPPAFSVSPRGQTLAIGSSFTLTAQATGTPAPHFQWFKNGSSLPGATTATFSIAAAQLADAGSYHVTASNVAGTVTSAAATIALSTPPVIANTPAPQTVTAGQRVQFIVTTSTPAVTYQWLRNSVAIPGATAATYTIDSAAPADAAEYSVRLTNSFGSVTSPAATLTVRFSRLVNLSTRGFVPPGGSLTPGFFIKSSAPKPLLIRAVGPTLATFGVGTALGEATLDVIAQSSTAVVASNSDWGGTSTLSNAFASVGAFPLAADSKDAALQTDLASAGYSVRIAPRESGQSGITLAEIYDADSTASSGRLVNLSTLGFVGTGENVLTAGFVISGNTAKRVLIRAIGPGLAPFGVSDVLANPQLGLVPLGGNEPLATNDDWPNVADLRNAFTNAGAFQLADGSKDAALVVTLEPGAYTVIVSSVDGRSTGQALVEIYDLDP